MILKLLLIFGLTVNPVKVFESKSTVVDGNIVLMQEPTGPEDALHIKVESKYAFHAVRATRVGDGRPSSVRKFGDGYIITGEPGLYVITLFESDPKLGINFIDVEGTLGGTVAPPPVNPSRLYEVALEQAKRAADIDTARELAKAYDAIATRAEFTVEDIQRARRQVLMLRQNTKSKWDTFLIEVDDALGPTVEREELKTIAKALRDAAA
jgi:hypothetical protein